VINAILGRLDVFGTIVEFTRQEAAIVHCLMESGDVGATSPMMTAVIFGEHTAKSGKTLGVHMCNIRKKLPEGVAIKFDAVRGVYELNDRRN
jgi:DNA-binding response OmpR family regulator